MRVTKSSVGICTSLLGYSDSRTRRKRRWQFLPRHDPTQEGPSLRCETPEQSSSAQRCNSLLGGSYNRDREPSLEDAGTVTVPQSDGEDDITQLDDIGTPPLEINASSTLESPRARSAGSHSKSQFNSSLYMAKAADNFSLEDRGELVRIRLMTSTVIMCQKQASQVSAPNLRRPTSSP